MTYKNGIKEYTLTAVLFGVPMGILLGISNLSLLIGVITGILGGLLFTLLMFLFVKFQEKKFAQKRIEIAKQRKIICDGGATIQGNGGWMFLTEWGIEFYPHKINFSRKEITIPTSMIKTAKAHKNKIIIDTVNNQTIAIIVSHKKEWEKQINAALASFYQEQEAMFF